MPKKSSLRQNKKSRKNTNHNTKKRGGSIKQKQEHNQKRVRFKISRKEKKSLAKKKKLANRSGLSKRSPKKHVQTVQLMDPRYQFPQYGQIDPGYQVPQYGQMIYPYHSHPHQGKQQSEIYPFHFGLMFPKKNEQQTRQQTRQQPRKINFKGSDYKRKLYGALKLRGNSSKLLPSNQGSNL